MPVTPDETAQRLLAATGVARAEVPPRRYGADWFREQPAWLAASAAADRLIRDPGYNAAPALEVAADILDDPTAGPAAVELVEVGFIEAMVCSASHRTDHADSRIIAASPLRVWGTWHRKRERLEALSEQALAAPTGPEALESDDAAVAMVARCTTYRAESGRYVILADLISADRPSPWPLRHPFLVGLLFGGCMFVLLILSLLRW